MGLPKLFLEILGSPAGLVMATETASKAVDGLGKKSTSNFNKLASVGGAAFKAISVGGLAAGVATVKMAGDFQQSTSRLVTDGGESSSAIDGVRNHILSLMGQVGDSSSDLVNAMNTIESAGFHAAQGGLDVLKVAAQGAKVGNADLGTTANALTSELNAYGQSSKSATGDMNMMIATVAAGKMHMEDLAGSISNVLPVAAAAHIQFQEVGGAMATMTAQGMSADQASQDLANTIRSLQNPNQVAVKEMTALGLNSTQVADQLGKKGLTGTLSELTEAVAKHVKGGDVFISSLKQSQAAAQDAQAMIAKLPKSVQASAKAFLDGQITQKQWTAQLKGMPPLQANLAKQFATMAKSSQGFNDLLKSGSPQAQTFTAALSDMLGGSTGLNTALMLTGDHMATFQANVKSVGDAAHEGGGQVKDWATVQQNFNQQLDEAKARAEALGIKIGTALMPWVLKLLHATEDVVSWFHQHKAAAIALASVIGGVLSIAIGAYFIKLGKGIVDNTKAVFKFASDVGKAFKSVGGAISTGVSKIGDLASAAKSGFETTAVRGMYLKDKIVDLASSAKSGFETVALKGMYAKDKIVELASSAGSKLVSMGSTIAEWASSAASAMASAGKAVIGYGIKLGTMAMEAATSFITMAGEALAWAGSMLVAGAEALLPFLPIILAVAAVAAAAYLLYKYWDQIWGFIKGIALDAWHFLDNDVFQPIKKYGIDYIKDAIQALVKIWSYELDLIKDAALAVWHFLDGDVFQPIKKYGLDYIKDGIQNLKSAWDTSWGDVKKIALDAWHFLDDNVLQPILTYGVHPVRDGISELKRIWDDAWNGLKTVVNTVWGYLKPIFDTIKGAIDDVSNGLNALTGNANKVGGAGSAIGKALKLPGFDEGGIVPGPKGAPMLAIVHGGEYVVSNDMMAGRASTSGLGLAGAGGGTTVIVQAQGSIMTLNDIYQDIRELFFQDGRRLPNTWPSTSPA